MNDSNAVATPSGFFDLPEADPVVLRVSSPVSLGALSDSEQLHNVRNAISGISNQIADDERALAELREQFLDTSSLNRARIVFATTPDHLDPEFIDLFNSLCVAEEAINAKIKHALTKPFLADENVTGEIRNELVAFRAELESKYEQLMSDRVTYQVSLLKAVREMPGNQNRFEDFLVGLKPTEPMPSIEDFEDQYTKLADQFLDPETLWAQAHMAPKEPAFDELTDTGEFDTPLAASAEGNITAQYAVLGLGDDHPGLFSVVSKNNADEIDAPGIFNFVPEADPTWAGTHRFGDRFKLGFKGFSESLKDAHSDLKEWSKNKWERAQDSFAYRTGRELRIPGFQRFGKTKAAIAAGVVLFLGGTAVAVTTGNDAPTNTPDRDDQDIASSFDSDLDQPATTSTTPTTTTQVQETTPEVTILPDALLPSAEIEVEQSADSQGSTSTSQPRRSSRNAPVASAPTPEPSAVEPTPTSSAPATTAPSVPTTEPEQPTTTLPEAPTTTLPESPTTTVPETPTTTVPDDPTPEPEVEAPVEANVPAQAQVIQVISEGGPAAQLGPIEITVLAR